jgi:elongation factor Ts
MSVSAAEVNELRKKTGAGMMDCKKALTEADGNFEKAIEILRKKGASVAAKRAEKTANEGVVVTKISEDSKKAVIVEVNCETDFVAKSEDFIQLANKVAEKTFLTEAQESQKLLDANTDLKNLLNDVMGKVGEKIEVSRVATEKAENVHMGAKLGVLVKFDSVSKSQEELAEIGKDIAMQVAAMSPICVYREEVPTTTIEKEIDIYKELARKEGKPENILDKIAQGKLNKFYQENCLIEQAFIKDNSKSVKDLVTEFNKKNGTEAKISLFKRFHLGDENK